jgi:hypothetical protein
MKKLGLADRILSEEWFDCSKGRKNKESEGNKETNERKIL